MHTAQVLQPMERNHVTDMLLAGESLKEKNSSLAVWLEYVTNS